MPDILYTIFIFPIEQIIELCYLLVFRITLSPGLSVIGLSIAVSTLILPLYIIAEKQQETERNKQKLMKQMKDNINSVFKGDKRYMMLSTLYRQNNYHPILALRNSFSLLIQIPFFIAAYHFLSNLELLNGKQFFIFNDLGSPDSLFYNLNILPVIMTLINIISGFIYTNDLENKDKIQVFAISFLFLVLLYNSPSALVLYWTCNNVYNLFKNILYKNKYCKDLLKYVLLAIASVISIYALFFHEGAFSKRFLLSFSLFIVVLFIFLYNKIIYYINTFIKKIKIKNSSFESPFKTFILSLICIVFLLGSVIPSSLIASSVKDFSPFASPLPYLFTIFLQSLGCAVYIVFIYFLFNKKIKIFLTASLTILLGIFILNTFVFQINYGLFNPDLTFAHFKKIQNSLLLLNIFSIILVSAFITFLLLTRLNKVILSFQCILAIGFLFFSFFNIYKINNEYKSLKFVESSTFLDKLYTFSKTGHNILLIVLDGASSHYITPVFTEKPELLDSFKGFVYYPNTVSFGSHTLLNMAGIFGGYHYTPYEMEKRKNESFYDQYHKGQMVLPIILSESNYYVNVYDQDLEPSLYENSSINAEITIGKYNNFLYEKYNNILGKDYNKILTSVFLRYSIFKSSPLIMHKFLYDHGRYLSFSISSHYAQGIINNYSSLYFLSEITEITDKNNNYANIFVNPLPHDETYLEKPNYIFSPNIANLDLNNMSYDGFFDVNMASILLLSKWFDFLQKNDIYNNTRIIIVSDHGMDSDPNYYPSKYFNPLLLVKDFNMEFDLKTDTSFMTNADVPFIMAADLGINLTDPFTGIKLAQNKNDGILLSYQPSVFQIRRNIARKNGRLNITSWLSVHTDIFNPDNWVLINNNL